MARDESKSAAQESLDRQAAPEEQPKRPDPAPVASEPKVQNATPEAQETVAADTVQDERPDVTVRLAEDSDLEAPVAVSIPTLYTDKEPLPTPDAIRDDDGEFLPGYDENTPTLVETENGYERPEDDLPEARVELDEHGRLVLDSSPVTVPAIVADVLVSLPFVEVVSD